MSQDTGTHPAGGRRPGTGRAGRQDWLAATALGIVAVVAVGVSLAGGPGSSGPAGPDQTPMKVSVTTAMARNVLVVPTAALLGGSRCGYAVEMITGGRHYLAWVTPGLVDAAARLVLVTRNLVVTAVWLPGIAGLAGWLRTGPAGPGRSRSR